MRVRPLGDQLVVRLDKRPAEERSAGGLVLSAAPSTADRIFLGEVLAAGPGWRGWSARLKKEVTRPMEAKVGDRVAFLRENLEHSQGKQITRIMQRLEENTALIAERDVLWVEE